jgi:glycosyltransferase
LKISLITPVYNDIRVSRALDSIFSQRMSADLEVIVVDGGSTDGTRDVLSRYETRISCLISEPDAGIYDAMNKGIRCTTGDVIGILNADDRYADDDALAHVVRAFEDVTLEACYGDLIYVDRNDRIIRYWKSGPYRRWRFSFGWMPPHPTFFVRRDVYDRYGVFDPDFTISADYELMVRFLHRERLKVTYIPRVLVHMATGGHSGRSARNIIRANWQVFMAGRRNRLPLSYLVPLLKPSSKIADFLRRPRSSPEGATKS